MKHAYFSPSAASRWIFCPASLFLSEQIKEKTSSTYAHEGTVCHDIAANCLTKQQNALDYAGKIIDGVSMTSELIAGIQLYVDEIRGLAKEYKASGGKIEHKVEITKNCWGTSDAFLWNNDTLLVCDLKMGKGIVVSADDNPQLKLYSIGCLSWLYNEHRIKPTKVINIIIQPRTPDPIRKWEIDKQDLKDWYVDEVADILQEFKPGQKPIAVCNPGEIQCRWCPVSATCAAQANRMVNDAQTAFAPFTKAPAPAPALKVEGSLEISEVVVYKGFFNHIQQWMKTIDTFLNDKALAGERIPGFKLVEGRSNRKWKQNEQHIVTFLRNLNTEPYTKKLVSPAQAEKTLGKKMAKEYDLDNLITKPPGNPTLVPEADKRPQMRLNVEPEFEEFAIDNPVPAMLNDTPLLVDDVMDEDVEMPKMSALKRMQLATLDDVEETIKEIPSLQKASDVIIQVTTKKLVETATSGNPTSVTKVEGNGNPKPPDAKTKRYQILNFGKGGVTLQNAAATLGCGVNMIKMHLRYLNERDGYSYEIYSDDTFKVY